ncbi:GNAT family N-acetyltransferase [Paenibacillus sp. PK3_47]|uniref:GNAT family N-acetyltransferase n=1 Tax=Paenibacillus sp. PK3_47 TaxID=2072642 RepID=UPI00201E07B8|nr:N-acetyltransferase [Paenibacillus sp. PK3_47]UQZ32620.1 GNAT family N-acetyltransferase [Paenibacillus sp. PK3_47]
MIIRTETAGDYRGVFELNYRAFGNREDESRLIERIRDSEEFIPELSIVAEDNGAIVGHVLLSKAKVVSELTENDVLVLAPLAVHPDAQGRGTGGLLIEEAKRRSSGLGYSVILLIGHPGYYPKFGFKPARQYGLELLQFPVPDDVFQVCELEEGGLDGIKGELRYPGAFL